MAKPGDDTFIEGELKDVAPNKYGEDADEELREDESSDVKSDAESTEEDA